jgi:mannose-6-phosphate isomerase-like protein (cupin superfamily)
MTESDTNRLLIVGPEEGEAYRVSGHQIVIKAGASATGGHYGLIESRPSAGSSPPLHIHHGVDEAVWVVQGQIRFRCGERDFPSAPEHSCSSPATLPTPSSYSATRTPC